MTGQGIEPATRTTRHPISDHTASTERQPRYSRMIGFSTSGASTDEARKDGSVFGLVRRLSKRRAAANQAGHQGRLTGVYTDAIEINGGSMVAAGGYVTTFGLVGGVLMTSLSYQFLASQLYDMPPELKFPLLLFAFCSFYCIFLIGIYFEMFSPSELKRPGFRGGWLA